MTIRPPYAFLDFLVGCVILAILVSVVLLLLSLVRVSGRSQAVDALTGPGIVTPAWHDSPGTAGPLDSVYARLPERFGGDTALADSLP